MSVISEVLGYLIAIVLLGSCYLAVQFSPVVFAIWTQLQEKTENQENGGKLYDKR